MAGGSGGSHGSTQKRSHLTCRCLIWWGVRMEFRMRREPTSTSRCRSALVRLKRPTAAWNLVGRGWKWFTGIFNRGFDRLSYVYGGLAGFVIRHRVVMLLVYVVLIGGAGWLLATTPQGFIPAQDRGYVIVAVQL